MPDLSRSERLLAILQHLRGRRGPTTAAALAETFGVSERTIRRDVAALNRTEAVIGGEAGFGYALLKDGFLPPMAFSAAEAEALLLGLRFVARRGDQPLMAAARSAKAKLAAAAPQRFDDVAGRASPLVVAPAASAPAPLTIVREALATGTGLRIRYRDGEGRLSERAVWPVMLGWFDACEMLAAWCGARQAFRHFRLDRIEDAQPCDRPPPRSREALLASYQALEPGAAL